MRACSKPAKWLIRCNGVYAMSTMITRLLVSCAASFGYGIQCAVASTLTDKGTVKYTYGTFKPDGVWLKTQERPIDEQHAVNMLVSCPAVALSLPKDADMRVRLSWNLTYTGESAAVILAFLGGLRIPSVSDATVNMLRERHADIATAYDTEHKPSKPANKPSKSKSKPETVISEPQAETVNV